MIGRWHGTMVERPQNARERRVALRRRREQLRDALDSRKDIDLRIHNLRQMIRELEVET